MHGIEMENSAACLKCMYRGPFGAADALVLIEAHNASVKSTVDWTDQPMKLPNRAQAYVPPKKLTGYLLSATHPVGKDKARFFRMHGYADENPFLLEAGLLNIARQGDVDQEKHSVFGTKYVIHGTLRTPRNRVVAVTTVWIIELGEYAPRLVTAYPRTS